MEKAIIDILPPDLWGGESGFFEIPPFAFLPDTWSFCFLRGLRKLQLDGKKVWEVGVGTGLNIFCLHQWFPQAKKYFSDFNPDCTILAVRNLASAGIVPGDGLVPLCGKWDLVDCVDNGAQAPCTDLVLACIPQVPAPKGCDLRVGDHLAHYYDPARYASSLNALGLGLNSALLQRAKRVLPAGGQVVLNLGGRPGLPRLLEMFCVCGYVPRVVYEEVIPQHAGTSLEPLASMEGDGQGDFEFFADVEARVRVNARAAEERRTGKLEVFHKIYVIEGTMSVD